MTPLASGRSEAAGAPKPTAHWIAGWVPVALYALAIVAASSIPATSMPAGALWRHDKLIHAAEYAVLAALVVRGVLYGAPTRRIGVAIAIAAAAAILFGISDELHQLATPGRDSSWKDLLADGVGAVVGAGVVAVWYRRARRSRPPAPTQTTRSE